jgi:hypothetical protein
MFLFAALLTSKHQAYCVLLEQEKAAALKQNCWINCGTQKLLAGIYNAKPAELETR